MLAEVVSENLNKEREISEIMNDILMTNVLQIESSIIKSTQYLH